MTKHYENKVDFREFLPNSLVNSPKKKMHSNSYRTESLGLAKTRSGAKSEQSSIAATSTRGGTQRSRMANETEPRGTEIKTEDGPVLVEQTVDKDAML